VFALSYSGRRANRRFRSLTINYENQRQKPKP